MARAMPSVYASRELQAVVLSMKALPREVRNAVARNVRQEMTPVWRSEVRRRPDTALERAAFGGAGTTIKGSNPFVLRAGGRRRALRGGMIPAADIRSIEFGSKRRNRRATWQRRSRAGNVHTVHGWPERQLPEFTRGGQVAYPAFKTIAPRVMKLTAATVVRKTYDALRGEL